MMLGDLLAAARGLAGQFQSWLQSAAPDLAERVESASEQEGLSPAGFVRMAVADFSRFASEEDWATLTSSIRDSAEPGTVCLLAMVHWRLTVRGCGDHSFHPVHEQGAADERSPKRAGV